MNTRLSTIIASLLASLTTSLLAGPIVTIIFILGAFSYDMPHSLNAQMAVFGIMALLFTGGILLSSIFIYIPLSIAATKIFNSLKGINLFLLLMISTWILQASAYAGIHYLSDGQANDEILIHFFLSILTGGILTSGIFAWFFNRINSTLES